jgi:hypothetical protein
VIGLLWFVLAILVSPFRSKARLESEIAVLRQQLIVLQRTSRSRVLLSNGDRLFFVQLYRWFPSILQVLQITRSFSTEVRATLGMPVVLTDSDRPRKVTTSEAALMRLREKALKGEMADRWLILPLRRQCSRLSLRRRRRPSRRQKRARSSAYSTAFRATDGSLQPLYWKGWCSFLGSWYPWQSRGFFLIFLWRLQF